MQTLDDKYRSVTSAWQQFRDGDYVMLGDIFQHLYRELYYYGVKLVSVPDLVKDTIQDIFVDVWSRRQKMREVSNIKAYLFIAVRRELLRRIGNIRKESFLEDCSKEPFLFSVEDFMIREENGSNGRQLLVQSLQRLTERQREVILLRFNHELEFQDISLMMGMNVQSVRNLLFRALEKIRNDLSNSNIMGFSDLELFLFCAFQKKEKSMLPECMSIES